MDDKKKILLTNDDGYFSPGIKALQERLSRDYHVVTVAPDKEMSAVSMSLTLNHPLRMHAVDRDVYAVSGTTADCVNVALQKILADPPDFVVSGMNLGENLAEDVFFSGTVGGAFTGHLYDLPALAVSMLPVGGDPHGQEFRFDSAAEVAARVLARLLDYDHHAAAIYNLNIPAGANGRVVVTRLGRKHYRPDVIERLDPRGRKYFWIGTGSPTSTGGEGTDIWAVAQGLVSLSVVSYEVSDPQETDRLRTLFP